MITIEQAQGVASDVAHRAGMPSDMSIGLWIGPAQDSRTGTEYEVIRVGIIVEDPEGGEALEARIIMENRATLQLETFEVWLLGWVQGSMAILHAADLRAAEEDAGMFAAASERVH